MTPDTRGYMIAAYVVVALVLGGYVLSLLTRARRVERALRRSRAHEERRSA